jgi:hypothetical protein
MSTWRRSPDIYIEMCIASQWISFTFSVLPDLGSGTIALAAAPFHCQVRIHHKQTVSHHFATSNPHSLIDLLRTADI